MQIPEEIAGHLAVALGIGLLIGAERERSKGEGPARAPAGIRTFALTALAGALSTLLGGQLGMLVVSIIIGSLVVLGYLRSRTEDPGLTTEVALLITFLLGALAMSEPGLATGVGVSVAIVLSLRTRLHQFVRSVLTEQELHDGLLLAGAALVVLPLVPDHAIGPLHVVNPRTIWALVVLVMSINAAGYVALRVFGARRGLPLAGFLSGFVSSAATVAAMGERARQTPETAWSAASSAVLSSVATVLYLVVVLGATSPPTLGALAVPLLLSGLAAGAYAAVFALRDHAGDVTVNAPPGRPFDLRTALMFAVAVAAVMFVVAFIREWMGVSGLTLATGLAGFADTHTPAISVAMLAAAGKLSPTETVVPVLAAYSTNALTKIVVAQVTGGRRFAGRVAPGVVLMVAAAWAGVFW